MPELNGTALGKKLARGTSPVRPHRSSHCDAAWLPEYSGDRPAREAESLETTLLMCRRTNQTSRSHATAKPHAKKPVRPSLCFTGTITGRTQDRRSCTPSAPSLSLSSTPSMSLVTSTAAQALADRLRPLPRFFSAPSLPQEDMGMPRVYNWRPGRAIPTDPRALGRIQHSKDRTVNPRLNTRRHRGQGYRRWRIHHVSTASSPSDDDAGSSGPRRVIRLPHTPPNRLPPIPSLNTDIEALSALKLQDVSLIQ